MPITGWRCLFFIFKTAQKPDLILTHIFKTLKMLQVVNVFRTNHFRLMALKLFLYRLSHCDSIVFLHRDSSAFKKGSLSFPLIMRSCGYSCNRFLVNRTTIPPPPPLFFSGIGWLEAKRKKTSHVWHFYYKMDIMMNVTKCWRQSKSN